MCSDDLREASVFANVDYVPTATAFATSQLKLDSVKLTYLLIHTCAWGHSRMVVN